MAHYVPTADAPPRRESLANTGLAHSHPSTPARLPPAHEDSDEELDDESERASLAATAETGDTEDTYTGVSYRFPTSGANSNLAGVASPSPGSTPGVGTPGVGSMAGVASTSVGSMAGVASTAVGVGGVGADLSTPTGSIGSNGSRGPQPGSYF